MAKITESFFRNTTSKRLNKQLELNRYNHPPTAEELYNHYLNWPDEEEKDGFEEFAEMDPEGFYLHLALDFLEKKLKFDYEDRVWLYEEMFVEGTMDNDIYNTFHKSQLEGKKRPWED